MSGRWVSLRPSQERETKRVFGNGRRTWAATPAPSVRPASLPVGGRRPCLRSLKASRKASPWRRFRPVRGYGARRFHELATASAWSGPSRAFSLVKTRRSPCARSVGRGSPCSAVGGGRFYAGPQGFRRPSPLSGPLRRRGGDDERGTLGRDAALRLSAYVRGVMAFWQAAFRVAAYGAVDADPVGSRERRWTRGLR